MSIIELIASVNDEHQADSQKMNGVAVGIVEDIRDPQKFGRVRVRFPWLAEKKEDTVSIEEGGAPAAQLFGRGPRC